MKIGDFLAIIGVITLISCVAVLFIESLINPLSGYTVASMLLAVFLGSILTLGTANEEFLDKEIFTRRGNKK